MIRVLRPGLQTSVQDPGRHGYRHLGVGQAGAADGDALRLANRLLGNPLQAAGLEITLLGPLLEFTTATQVALTGAGIEASVDGRPLPLNRPFHLSAGTRLALGRCRRGARCYLGVSGGIDVEPLMGSRSTDLGSGFGGLEGRALRRGDRLRVAAGSARRLPEVNWWVDRPSDFTREGLPDEVLRILPAEETGSSTDLLALHWQVDGRSSRKALRLRGPSLPVRAAAERISQPVAPGDIQVLPDGEPLLLGVEAQTVGGYPLLGRVIRADRDRLGQLRPGDPVRFMPVDLARADAAWASLQSSWERLEIALLRRGVDAGD